MRPYKVASPAWAPYRALSGRKRRAGVKFVKCAAGPDGAAPRAGAVVVVVVVLGASAGRASETPFNEPVDPLVCLRPGAAARRLLAGAEPRVTYDNDNYRHSSAP